MSVCLSVSISIAHIPAAQSRRLKLSKHDFIFFHHEKAISFSLSPSSHAQAVLVLPGPPSVPAFCPSVCRGLLMLLFYGELGYLSTCVQFSSVLHGLEIYWPPGGGRKGDGSVVLPPQPNFFRDFSKKSPIYEATLRSE